MYVPQTSRCSSQLTIHSSDGDQNHFPVYVPDAERVAEIEEAYAEASKDPTMHYDASNENRATGAGFYQFSADEETRARQMEALKRSREETEKARQETGVAESRASNDATATSPKGKGNTEEVDAGHAPKITGRGIDKRKRELEERRQAIEAKRRKTNNAANTSTNILGRSQPPGTSSTHSIPSHSMNNGVVETNSASTAADNFLEDLEAELLKADLIRADLHNAEPRKADLLNR
jgi:hypothetical protein